MSKSNELIAAAQALLAAGDHPGAAEKFQEAVELEPTGVGWQGLGIATLSAGDDTAAAMHFGRAAECFAEEGDVAQAAVSEGNKAAMDFGAGRIVDAAAGFRSAMTKLANAGLPGSPEVEMNLARALFQLGQEGEGIERAGKAALLAHQQQNAHAEGNAWELRGEMLVAEDRGGEAVQPFGQAVEAFETAGYRFETLRSRVRLAEACFLEDRHSEAADAYSTALPDLREFGSDEDVIGVLVNLGGVYYALHDHVLALECCDEALNRFPASLVGTELEARLRANRGLAVLVGGDLELAAQEITRAKQLYQDLGLIERYTNQLATLSNIARYTGDVEEAVELQRVVMKNEREHGFRIAEPGGLMYSALEDRSLNLFDNSLSPESQKDRIAKGGRQFAPADTDATFSNHASKLPGFAERPVVMISPPAYGAFAPIFPRGATSIASFLNTHGVPSLVVPLAHYVDDFMGAESARIRTREVLKDVLDQLNPRAIGLSVTFSYLYPRGLEMARMIKEMRPDIPIVIGGPHVTYYDRDCLNEAPEIDIVARGEGEWTALELFEALEHGRSLEPIHGISYRLPDGSIKRNPHRALGNVPDLSDIDFRLLPDAFCKTMEVSALTSRGCAFRCRYCHEFRYWGGIVREHPIERIVGELERISKDYGNWLRGIDDSMLDMYSPYFMELIHAVGRSDHLPDNFGFLTRLDTISDEGLAAMTQYGIRSLSVGAESGSQAILDAMLKELKVETIVDALRRAADAGVGTNAFFIIGHPGDGNEESEVTLNFIDRLFKEGLVSWTDLSIFTPYPGTPFYMYPEKYGVEILTKEWSLWRRSNRPIAQLTDYKADEIYLNYLRTLEVQAKHLAARGQMRASAK